MFLNKVSISVPDVLGTKDLSSPLVQVCFNYCKSAKDNKMLVERKLEPAVLWCNEHLDVAVLQLRTARGLGPHPSLGDHLEAVEQRWTKKFHLIGHCNGGYKDMNVCCEKRPLNHPDVQALLSDRDYSPKRFPTLLDPRRTLLEASMTFGASGSPCFDDRGKLVLMQTEAEYLREVHLFDQGVNLIDVYRLMLGQERELAVQLFGLRPELEQGNSTQCGLLFFLFSFIFCTLSSSFTSHRTQRIRHPK